jgi:hypothetical protein
MHSFPKARQGGKNSSLFSHGFFPSVSPFIHFKKRVVHIKNQVIQWSDPEIVGKEAGFLKPCRWFLLESFPQFVQTFFSLFLPLTFLKYIII